MTRAQAINYALKKIPEILPLEERDIRALCEQVLKSAGSNSDLIAQEFLNILGHEDAPFEFVIQFNQILLDDDQVKKIPPVNKQLEVKVPPTSASKTDSNKQYNDRNKHHTPKNNQNNGATKPAKETKTSKAQKERLLEEIDEAWKFLELEHNEQDIATYACNCQGKRYPLFEIAPNCLSCGRIICVREGLHLNNCSFCGHEIIPLEEKLKIIQLLKNEKNELSNGTKKIEGAIQPQRSNTKNKYAKSYKIASGMGTNLFSEQDKLFDLIERQQERERKRNEVLKLQEENQKEELKINKKNEEKRSTDPELWEAQERLDKLLHFQDTSAERTKIIDNASDFSISQEGSVWGSAEQRALMIKKQQRNLKNFEKLERERNGNRDKYVVSMTIGSDGKVTMNEVVKDNGKVVADSDEDLEEISDDDDKKDLTEIYALKDEIETRNSKQKNILQNNVWDHDKYGKQFNHPKYIDPSSKNKIHSCKRTENDTLPSRIQVDESEENFWDRIA